MKSRRVAVTFTEQIFEKVMRRAKDDEVSFSTKALELIRCGLFDYEESEKHEPPKQSKKK